MKQTTHSELCEKVAKWLKEKGRINPATCTFAVIEKKSILNEIPDVFGWNSFSSVMVEVKVSRSDFLADKKKQSRIEPEKGLGEYKFYCCPVGVIEEKDLPSNWGLLVLENEKIYIAKHARRQEANYKAEAILLKSIILENENNKPKRAKR